MKGDGGFAYPQPLCQHPSGQVVMPTDIGPGGGMSLRDWFAGKAIQACTQLLLTSATTRPDAKEAVAHWAYEIADAMLAEREKPQS